MTQRMSIGADGASAAREALDRCVQRGGVALFPADTLYALACDPSSAAAIERIHGLKGRDAGKPSAVMFFSALAMRELVSTLGSRTRDALGVLLPGPVTAVVHNAEHRYPLACREDPQRLGVRLIEGPLAGAACAVFQTSANRSGEPAPHRFEDVDPDLLAGDDEGLFLPEASRGSLDPLSGEFALHLPYARRFRRGTLAETVGPCVLRGRVADLLTRVTAVGHEARPAGAGWCAKGGQKLPVWATAPALRLEGVDVTPARPA